MRSAIYEEAGHVYPHQIERLSAALESGGLSALVATTAANVQYLTGFRSLTEAVFHTPHFAVFTPRGTALVVPAVDLPPIVADAIAVDHVVCFGRFVAQYAEGSNAGARVRALTEQRAASPAEGLARALEALGVRGAIGLDEGALTAATWQQMAARLAPLTLVPAADRLRAARRVKSPYEIECLARALGIAEEAANAVIQALKPGMTEREALIVYGTEVLKRGAELVPATIAFGEDTWIPASAPTDRVLRGGDLVRLDLGCVFKGYHASLARMAVTGEPGARQQVACDAVHAGLEAAVRAVSPGTPAGRIHEAAVAATRAAGLAAFERYHVGHGIGLEPYERPKLAADDPTPLEVGEVLRVEVPYFEIGWAGVNVRDTLLVTTRSCQVMNRSARALVVLD
jgi:Xaa-Pro aminopeptidase